MSQSRLYARTVHRCIECPAYMEPPLSRFASSRCTEVTPLHVIDDPSSIPDWCPLPAEENHHSPSCPRCGAPSAHIGETPLPDGNGSCDQNLAESITGGAP